MTLLANATKRGMQQGHRRMNRLAKPVYSRGGACPRPVPLHPDPQSLNTCEEGSYLCSDLTHLWARSGMNSVCRYVAVPSGLRSSPWDCFSSCFINRRLNIHLSSHVKRRDNRRYILLQAGKPLLARRWQQQHRTSPTLRERFIAQNKRYMRVLRN